MNQDEEHKSDVIADQAGAELAELRAENERLRKALEKITELTDDGFIYSIALEALGEK